MAKLVSGTLVIDTPATAERITSTSTLVDWILLFSAAGETATIVVGDASVVAAAATRKGIVLPECGTDGANTIHPLRLDGPLDLAELWFDTLTAAGTVEYLYRKSP